MSGGRLVEIGPAHGAFALQAVEAGFDVTAIEMDERCCRYLESVVGVAAVHDDRPHEILRDRPPSDAVVMWQVIERLPDPWRCLRSAAQNLHEGGVLLVATPNPAGSSAAIRGRAAASCRRTSCASCACPTADRRGLVWAQPVTLPPTRSQAEAAILSVRVSVP